jgi:hypothetical protein
VWSNLLSPVAANYLPGSSGENDYSYIMVGVNYLDVANVGVSVNADATILSKLKASVCYFDANKSYVFVSGATASFAADGTTNISISDFPLDSVVFTSKYFVVVWEDNDGSGTYNPDDDLAVDSSSWCQIVFADRSTLQNAYGTLNAVKSWWGGLDDAQNFLQSFMDGTAPSGVTTPTSISSKQIPPNYKNNDANLHHNTGVAWASSTTGTIPLYIYDNNSALSAKIQANTDFINTIINTMTSSGAIHDVQNYNFGSDPDHWFHWNGPNGPLQQMTFNWSAQHPSQNNLFFAMRNVNLSDYVVWVRVQAGTLKVLQVAVYGNVNCIYSFSFEELAPVPGFENAFQCGALLQSAYSTHIGDGQVFYYQVSFDNGDITVPPYTYPPP